MSCVSFIIGACPHPGNATRMVRLHASAHTAGLFVKMKLAVSANYTDRVQCVLWGSDIADV